MKVAGKKITYGMSIAGVLLLFFLLHYIGITRPFENVIVRVVQSVQGWFYSQSSHLGTWYTDRRSISQLQAENEGLRTAALDQTIEKAAFMTLTEENEFLRTQLDVREQGRGTPVVARVIGRSVDEARSTITINQGKKAGIQVGYPVIVHDGIMVGKVFAVHDYNATIMLVNDHTSQVAVAAMTGDHTIGVVRGEYGLGLKMELIPQIELLKEQDLIVTSGIEQAIPRGLVVGTVDSIQGSVEELFKTAVIRVPVDYTKVYMVSVLIPPQL